MSKTEAVSKTVEELQAAWKAAQKRSNAAHAAWRDASERVSLPTLLSTMRGSWQSRPPQVTHDRPVWVLSPLWVGGLQA